MFKYAVNSREDIRAKKHEIKAYKAQRSSNYTDFIPDIVVFAVFFCISLAQSIFLLSLF